MRDTAKTRGYAHRKYLAALTALGLLLAACAPAAPASPTAAPAKAPQPTTAPAKPAATTAPAKAPQPTAAPAKPAEKPAEKPAAKPAATTAPAKTEPKPAAKVDTKAIEDFYKGKTVRVIVATTAGSLFDAWGRAMARHMPRYIPGNPNMIVENMPGAGHVIGANHLYKIAPKDGTVIGTFVESQVLNQLTGGKGIEFDMAKFAWLGSASSSNIACLVRSDIGAKVTDLNSLTNANQEVIFSTTGPGSSGYEYPLLAKELLGAKVKLVSGYPGNQEVRLAIENGEAEGYCATWDAVRRGAEAWDKAGTPPYKIVLQEGSERHPDLKDVPLMRELAKNADDKRMFELLSAPNDFAKPFAAPPEVPADRLQVLRQAFTSVFEDAEFRAEAQKADMDYAPKTGDRVQAGFADVLSTSKPLVERFQKLLGR